MHFQWWRSSYCQFRTANLDDAFRNAFVGELFVWNCVGIPRTLKNELNLSLIFFGILKLKLTWIFSLGCESTCAWQDLRRWWILYRILRRCNFSLECAIEYESSGCSIDCTTCRTQRKQTVSPSCELSGGPCSYQLGRTIFHRTHMNTLSHLHGVGDDRSGSIAFETFYCRHCRHASVQNHSPF